MVVPILGTFDEHITAVENGQSDPTGVILVTIQSLGMCIYFTEIKFSLQSLISDTSFYVYQCIGDDDNNIKDRPIKISTVHVEHLLYVFVDPMKIMVWLSTLFPTNDDVKKKVLAVWSLSFTFLA